MKRIIGIMESGTQKAQRKIVIKKQKRIIGIVESEMKNRNVKVVIENSNA